MLKQTFRPARAHTVHHDPGFDPAFDDRMPYAPVPNTLAPQRDVRTSKDDGEARKEIAPLTDDECFLAVNWVKGFAIQSKIFCELLTDVVPCCLLH